MIAKHLLFHDSARDKIGRGIKALAEAVKVTLGPLGRTVILEREFGPPQIVNSGVQVAKAVTLEDPFENIGAQLLREVATRTSEMADDGTTTATVLAQPMIEEGQRHLAAGMNPMGLKRGMERAIEAVVADVQQMARPCRRSPMWPPSQPTTTAPLVSFWRRRWRRRGAREPSPMNLKTAVDRLFPLATPDER